MNDTTLWRQLACAYPWDSAVKVGCEPVSLLQGVCSLTVLKINIRLLVRVGLIDMLGL